MLAEDLGRLLRPDASGAGELVGGVAAQRDQVGHLPGLDAVAFAHLGRADARDLAHTFRGLEDRHPIAHELERIAVGRRDEHVPRPRLRGGGEEVVGFVAGPFPESEAERPRECGHQRELLEQRLLEHPPGLVRLVRLMPVRRNLERVPADEHRVGALCLPESREHVREADDRVQPDRLRQAVIGAMRERVAVDRQEHAHNDVSSSAMRAIKRSVASWAASPASRPRRSSSSTGAP